MSNEDSQLVATIAANAPIQFETVMDELEQGEEGGGFFPSSTWNRPGIETTKEPAADPDPPGEEEEEEEEKEEQENAEVAGQEEAEDDPYKDYSDAAVVFEGLKSKRPELFGEGETKKDLDWPDLLDTVDEYVGNVLEDALEDQIEKLGNVGKYVDFLFKGGSPKVAQEAISHNKYSTLNAEEANDEQIIESIESMYKGMGIPEAERKGLIETTKLSGKLKEKGKEAILWHSNKETELMTVDKQRRDREKEANDQRVLDIRNNLTAIIDKGELPGGIILTDAQKKAAKEALFTQSEVVAIQNDKGQKETRTVSKYKILKDKFDNSLEHQALFVHLLLEDFKVNLAKQESKGKKAGELNTPIDALKRRHSREKQEKRTVNQNVWAAPVLKE